MSPTADFWARLVCIMCMIICMCKVNSFPDAGMAYNEAPHQHTQHTVSDSAVQIYRIFSPAYLTVANVISRSKIITYAPMYDNSIPQERKAYRCHSLSARDLYIVRDVSTSGVYICYCTSGTEKCSQPLLASGDPKLNCILGHGREESCDACTRQGELC